MIHFFVLVPRKRGMAPREFHDHWRHPHATVESRVPTLRHYALSHRLHTDRLGPAQSEFDGITEAVFDTVHDAMHFGEEPYYERHVEPDEPVFVDSSRLVWMATEEEVLVPRASEQDGADHADALWLHLDRPVSVKLVQFVRTGGSPDWAGEPDVDLGRRIGALRHVRNRPSRLVHGDEPPFRGVRQLWWPTLSAFEAGVAGGTDAFDELLDRAGDALTLLVQEERYLR
ncbi:EthD domain-containing protein [Saccharomonospora cyanea]|uniref:EthD protein n=1 Tax=Saccharomonospora cyanea NA-134 TaxID=882082 RepID=H5XQX4_9PSEU|nr:EthD domain-containing protein [Saccharomonospora cyanea]EHR61214.1 EthD protein [Saccharomonospora cyanea NA-134]